MKVCVKCGEKIGIRDAIRFDIVGSNPARYICPECAEEEGMETEEDDDEVSNDFHLHYAIDVIMVRQEKR